LYKIKTWVVIVYYFYLMQRIFVITKHYIFLTRPIYRIPAPIALTQWPLKKIALTQLAQS